MESVCACCLELKSAKSCTSISKIPEEKVYKYCIESDLTRNKNGNFYVCNTCKLSIMKDVEPRRSQKEILGLLEFPQAFMEELEQCCTRSLKEINDPEKKYLKLNRVEDYLLKPVIPFIRIGHLPRGRYFQLKGDLIMVSADVEETMNQILPRSQNLLPIAFKRKIEYHGHFMAEFIDRRKVQSYFKWFQQHNHLFKDFSLDEDLIEKFEQEAQEEVEEIDLRKNNLMTDHDTIKNKPVNIQDELYDSDEEVEIKDVLLEKEIVVNDNSSVITNKYIEDIHSNTVANKFSDMIISLEKLLSDEIEENLNPDPEDEMYVEDEIYLSDEDEDDDDEELLGSLPFEEVVNFKIMKKIKSESCSDAYWLKTNSNLKKLCKCGVIRKISSLMQAKYDLEKLKVEDSKAIAFKNELLKEFSACVEIGRRHLSGMEKNCHHKINSLSDDVENIIKNNEKNPVRTMEFVSSACKKIKENTDKLCVAPAEKGKWINWQSDIFLEEKLFPSHFPYGLGGYLSSNMLKKSNMGYSNYIKSRLLSANPKF